jgi:hypothetical protein
MRSILLHTRAVWRGPIIFAVALVLSAPAAAQIFQGTFHDPRKKDSVGFSVDLENSMDEVTAIVKKVASDTTIRGTKISTKDHAMELDDAQFASSSSVFGTVAAPSRAFYKVSSNAIAPIHFPGSNGSGTVVVRYVVRPVAAQRTRLLIDAVFFEESLHARYFSDGNVEAAEYGEILTLLNAHGNPRSRGDQPVQVAATEADTSGLQNTLADLQSRLAETNATERELEKQIEKLRFNTEGQVKTDGVPLKALPYNHSSTILTLQKGQDVTVLTTSKYWYRIRTPKGEEGWIYYEFLGPVS